MAKLYYKHGAMKGGKSLALIGTYKAYEAQGKHAIVIKPTIDTRDKGLASRLLKTDIEVTNVEPGEVRTFFEENKKLFKEIIINTDGRVVYSNEPPRVILLDEAQFFLRDDIEALAEVTLKYDIPVLAYGLKNDFQNELFEGSEALLILADSVEEIKSVCQYCDRKATMNLRLDVGGEASLEGDQIQVGDEEYVPVCRKHYYENI